MIARAVAKLLSTGKLEARVGIEPTYKGFADLWGFSILLTRLACTPFQLALFAPYSVLSLPKSCSSFRMADYSAKWSVTLVSLSPSLPQSRQSV